jgi:chitodextrinase
MRVKPPHASVGIIVLILLLGTTSSAFASAAKPHGSFRALTRLDRKAPTAPTALKVTRVTSSSITVAWKSSRDNFGVAGYAVYVNGALKDRTGTTSDALSGVDCGTSYVIAVAAYDLAGNNSQKASVIASTSPCVTAAPTPPPAGDTQAPSAPSGLTETAATGSQVSLSWNAATDNVGVTGYRAYFGGNQAGSTTSTNYTFSGLTCGSTYSVGVDAVDAAGNGSTIASAVVATAACPDTLSPTAVANLLPSQITTTAVALWWSPSLDNAGVTGYGIYRNGTRVGTTTATTYTVTGLTCGTSYQLGVDATDAAANRSSISTISVTTSTCGDTTPPTAPTGLAVSSVSQTGLTLNWSASTDGVGVAGYTVYRNGTQAGQTAATSYPLSSLACGTTYTLAVEARDAAGNISGRPSVSGATAACPAPPPPPPPPPPPSTGSNVSVAVSGNDSSCTRNGAPCATFNRAFAVAQAGDTVSVHGGAYPADSPSANRNQLDGSKTSPVTFVCAGDGNVTFQAPEFIFWAGTGNATFRGDCFHFHAVTVGLGGYPQLTHNIVLDGVHMDAPEIIGAKDIAIVNSEIGPFTACGAADAPAYADCDPGSYWAQFPNGTDAVQQQPFSHNGSAGKATNITLDHDVIHGITSKWSGTHTGGLLIWNTDNLRITNTVFAGNAVYDIEQNANSTDNGMVLQNNTFGYPVFTSDSGSPGANNGHREVECCGNGDYSNNWLLDHNTFTNGFRIAGQGIWSNSSASNNDFGAGADCGPFAGLTFIGNSRCG